MKLILIATILFTGTLLYSQSYKENHGARSTSMGGASATLADVWSVFNNQSAMVELKTLQAGISISNRFLIKELSVKNAAILMPLKSGAIGLKVSSFGYSLYQESLIGMAYGLKLSSKLNIGVGLNYESVNINAEGFTRKSALTGEISLLAKLSDKVQLATHIYNPTRAQLFKYNDERVATIFNLGACYNFDKKAKFVCELEKDVDFKPVIKGGVEFLPTENIYLRVGASNQPSIYSFGFGFKINQINIDVASAYHNTLGFSPQVSFIYNGKGK